MQKNNDINDMLDHPIIGSIKSAGLWGSYPSSEVPWPMAKAAAPQSVAQEKQSSQDAGACHKAAPLLHGPLPEPPPTGGWASLFQAEIDALSEPMPTPPGLSK